MEAKKSPKMRRRWRAWAFVFSPLGLAYLWCAFVDQESFGAFLLGVLFTILFGVGWLIKKAVE
jgi:hypothetical protein